jgi:hypothetical protein
MLHFLGELAANVWELLVPLGSPLVVLGCIAIGTVLVTTLLQLPSNRRKERRHVERVLLIAQFDRIDTAWDKRDKGSRWAFSHHYHLTDPLPEGCLMMSLVMILKPLKYIFVPLVYLALFQLFRDPKTYEHHTSMYRQLCRTDVATTCESTFFLAELNLLSTPISQPSEWLVLVMLVLGSSLGLMFYFPAGTRMIRQAGNDVPQRFWAKGAVGVYFGMVRDLWAPKKPFRFLLIAGGLFFGFLMLFGWPLICLFGPAGLFLLSSTRRLLIWLLSLPSALLDAHALRTEAMFRVGDNYHFPKSNKRIMRLFEQVHRQFEDCGPYRGDSFWGEAGPPAELIAPLSWWCPLDEPDDSPSET